MQRKEEEIRQFDLARQKELKNTLIYSRTQNQQINNNLEKQEQTDTPSLRR